MAGREEAHCALSARSVGSGMILLMYMYILQELECGGGEPSILRSMMENLSHLDGEAVVVEEEIAKNSAAVAYGGKPPVTIVIFVPSIHRAPAPTSRN